MHRGQIEQVWETDAFPSESQHHHQERLDRTFRQVSSQPVWLLSDQVAYPVKLPLVGLQRSTSSS
jgi:hypothetical protein